MTLEEIQELGFASICLKLVSESLTDEKLKARTLHQAGLVMDAHDELLTQYQNERQINE